MIKNYKTLTLLECVTYTYLYIPIFLFLLGWIKWIFAIPLCIMLTYFIYHEIKNNYEESDFHLKFLACLTLITILTAWCIVSGLNGYTKQPGDWAKHNILIKTLVNSDWPVVVNWNSSNGIMSYYIGSYILPAFLGKLFGIEVAYQATLIWSIIGTFLIVLNIQKLLRCKTYQYAFIIISCCFILFATFNAPLTGVYKNWNNDAADGVYWLSKAIRVQYTSNIMNMRWVYAQFIPTALQTVVLLGFKEKYERWGLICIPSILYSTFCFLGLVSLALLTFLQDVFLKKFNWKKDWKKVLSKSNIASLILALFLLIYIGANVFQTKPESANMSFKLINYSQHPLVLILFEFSWFAWILILLKNKTINSWLISASVYLFLLPFISYGEYNDLCMRGGGSGTYCHMLLCNR